MAKRLAVSCIAILFLAALPLAAVKDPDRVDSGQLSGSPGNQLGIQVYKGIPYAAPPAGDLRWRAPQPAASWPGGRAAKRFGAHCFHDPSPDTSRYCLPPRPV